MDTKKLYELARDVENAKNNLAGEQSRFDKAEADRNKAQALLDAKQQLLNDFLNEAASE